MKQLMRELRQPGVVPALVVLAGLLATSCLFLKAALQ